MTDYNRTLQIYFGLEGINHGNRQAQEKFELDEATENTPVMSTKANRVTTDRASRRRSTRKAKRHLRAIEPYTMSVRETRNGGIIHKGDTYSWLPYWKRMNSRLARYEGKREIAKFFADDSQPYDVWVVNSDENFPTREDGTIDLYTLLKYDEDDDDLGEDVYDTIYDLEQDIAKLRREINLYNDFLGEYNLGKLFETWLAANGKEAHYDR